MQRPSANARFQVEETLEEFDSADVFHLRDSGLAETLSQKLRRLNREIETFYREWQRIV